jgi:hypothetical protein
MGVKVLDRLYRRQPLVAAQSRKDAVVETSMMSHASNHMKQFVPRLLFGPSSGP